MTDVSRIERLAQEFIVRIRDDDPESNGRWYDLLSDDDRRGVFFALGAACPDDQPWSELIAWTQPETAVEKRRRQWRESNGRRRGVTTASGTDRTAPPSSYGAAS